MKNFLTRYWFLIGLAVAMLVGWRAAEPLSTISAQAGLRNAIVLLVMFLMALPLPLGMITATIRQPWAALLATLVNFGWLPLVAWALSGAVDPAFRAGFLVVAATPCTLASAAVWTRRGKGNEVTALMTTVLTNASSFLITPLIVFLLLGQTAEIEVASMVWKLGLLVLLPMILAQVLALREPVGRWAQLHKISLNTVAQALLLIIVLLGTVQSVLKMSAAPSPPLTHALGLILMCSLLHGCVLVSGWWIARLLGFSPADQVAVAFAGSQKTLMIGLLVSMQLGVSLLPMVVYHATQLVIDTLVADRFRHRPQD